MSSDENSLFERVGSSLPKTMAGMMSLPLLLNNDNININNSNNNNNSQHRYHNNYDDIMSNNNNSSSNDNNNINSVRKNELLSSLSSSSSFKPSNFQFFSSITYDDHGAMFGELLKSSPTLYLIENSVSVSNNNLNESTSSSNNMHSLLMEDELDMDGADYEFFAEDENDFQLDADFDENDGVNTAKHYRKIFEKNVIQVKKSAYDRYFLSLPDLRPISWHNANDYFFYSLQDLTNLTDFDDDDDDDENDDDDDENYQNNYNYMSTSNSSQKDENIFIGQQSSGGGTVENNVTDRTRFSDDEDDEEMVILDSGSEEISWATTESGNDVRTWIKVRKNADKSWERTTHVTTFYRDTGQSHTETYYETFFDDESDTNQSSDNDDDSLEEETVRKRYEKNYELKGNQYDLLKKCFDKMEDNNNNKGFINQALLKAHIEVQVRERDRLIRADEESIDRALSTIDKDEDANINFQDFLDFLYLFFASKKNLRTKVVSILTGHRRSHATPGKLNEKEARLFFEFLARFYGLEEEERGKVKFADTPQTYADFAETVSPALEEKLFVKWL